ncbi:hypothetical protein O6H91_09G106000 [Diphasiastrum complanatum]|uniref:Uncharacterized protein n=1 Tax=Diphasiastrum complanatum TaxID=34168 RepID=A0ACC2CSP9_DIPCM|nr:hypothetical protein O6H91_09G106000 [Diphasiastrum complanatum]
MKELQRRLLVCRCSLAGGVTTQWCNWSFVAFVEVVVTGKQGQTFELFPGLHMASAVTPGKMPPGLKRWASELAKGVWGYWKGGLWTPLAISARHRARLRKQTLLAGREWPYDQPRKEMKTKMKGHKVDREAAEKRKRTVELMEKMPQMLLDLKKRRWERKYKK